MEPLRPPNVPFAEFCAAAGSSSATASSSCSTDRESHPRQPLQLPLDDHEGIRRHLEVGSGCHAGITRTVTWALE
jgi:hypothetical protein